MNRFFRSALFPLVVIVLLVYLASQTLMPRRDGSEKMTYSQLIQATKNGDVSEVTFTPNRQSITAVLDSGQKVKVNYPSPQSQVQFQNVLEEHNVKFDSKGIGTSAWWALLTGFLPDPIQRAIFHGPVLIGVLIVGTGWLLWRIARPRPVDDDR